MLKTEIHEMVVQKVSQILEKFDGIGMDQDLAEIGLNSIKFITLLIELESSFDIEYEDRELLQENFRTIRRIMDGIAFKLGEAEHG